MESVLPSESSADVLLLGESEAIRAIDADIECAARSDAKVLITGDLVVAPVPYAIGSFFGDWIEKRSVWSMPTRPK